MTLGLALVSLALALVPAVVALANLAGLRTPASDGAAERLVSILIPARDEAAIIGATVAAALASSEVDVEVLVGDDHSTDGTARIVASLAEANPRLRLVAVPPLPEGWTGKNHACATLAAQARGDYLLFVDADVRLEPRAAAALSASARRGALSLVSGVPRQVMGSLGERLTVPIINFLLVGFLPMPMMRRRADPSLGAACGQLVLVERDTYAACGGHGSVRGALHDGVRLARRFREAGHRTDLVAGHRLATCRMYRGFGQAWAGFSKNAHEGMATPRGLPIWTLLLFGGQVLPWVLVVAALFDGTPIAGLAVAAAAAAVSLATRAAITLRSGEPLATVLLHPAAILVALAIQWNVLMRAKRAGAAVWKGRSYPVG